jgi:hypothetical protein
MAKKRSPKRKPAVAKTKNRKVSRNKPRPTARLSGRRAGRAKPSSLEFTIAVAPTTKRNIIYEAVKAQLIKDTRWPADDVTKHCVEKTMDSYRYTSKSLNNFLYVVQRRLAGENPAYTFSYDQDFVQAALPVSVTELMAMISRNTKASE